MSQLKILPPWEIYPCPMGCDDKCPRRWSNCYIHHDILCICKCHIDSNVIQMTTTLNK